MIINVEKDIILASTSPVRKKILKEVGLNFKTISPTCDEDSLKKAFIENKPDFSMRSLAIFLSTKKALSISKNYPNSYIIGSDQVCEFEGKEVSKSQDAKQAISQLSKFNNKIHFQNNGVVVAKNGKVIFKNFSKVKLKMRKLTQLEIEKYVHHDQSWGCAGSYKYESLGKHLFENVQGDYYAILGLAIQPLINFFHEEQVIKIS
ncbi:MAG: septum formation protein Maf [Rickettsiales bacterium]|nr:septum formation protein Maf [Rickettsiales bacterium]